jgi:hypothetical protein
MTSRVAITTASAKALLPTINKPAAWIEGAAAASNPCPSHERPTTATKRLP